MKFIVDSQLPFALAELLRLKGFDTIHVSVLPDGNSSTDAQINRLSIAESRIVISKDADFYNSFTSNKEPFKLLHVKTGNIRNSELLDLFERNLAAIKENLESYSVVQISRKIIIGIQE